MERPTIVIIGAGNVAVHLAKALDQKADVVQIYSRTVDHARDLASQLKDCDAIDDLSRLRLDADYYIISVKDDAVAAVAEEMRQVDGTVVHTSGSVGIDALGTAGAKGTGVMYPLQTFSKSAAVDVSKVPFFLEASDQATLQRIEAITRLISDSIHYADSASRTILHVAAVFGCNFVNHMLDISAQILGESGYSLDVLKPLIDVTIDKAMTLGPAKSQTGPAARHDTGVMDKHMTALNANHREIYRLISESIQNRNNNTK